MMSPGFITEFSQLFQTAAVSAGVNEKHAITGINKTDIADRARNIPAQKLAFINIIPDFSGSGSDNDQLADQAELMFFFLMKSNRKSPDEFLPIMDATLTAVMAFRTAILSGAVGANCSWIRRLDWTGAKIIPESNLYELSGWMLTLKTMPI